MNGTPMTNRTPPFESRRRMYRRSRRLPVGLLVGRLSGRRAVPLLCIHVAAAVLTAPAAVHGQCPFDWLPESVRGNLLSREHFVRVEPPFNGSAGGVEPDLFEGYSG